MSRKYIADTLKRLRIKSGYTADYVGKIIGKSGKTVNAWENNRGQPDADTLMALCDIYSVSDVLSEFKSSETHRENTIDNPALILSETEKNLVADFRSLNDDGQEKLLDNLDDLIKSGKYKKSNPHELGEKEA